MENILIKTDEIIEKLLNDEKIKRMMELKNIIDNDEAIQQLLNNFNDNRDNSIVDLKKELYNNSIINEYLSIQNVLDYKIMYFNNKLSKLLNSNKCSR